MLALAVAWLGWAFVSAAYAQSAHLWHSDGVAGQSNFGVTRLDRELALADFLWNSIEQIPRFFSVLNFAFTRRLWLVGIFVGLEVAVYFFGRKMKQGCNLDFFRADVAVQDGKITCLPGGVLSATRQDMQRGQRTYVLAGG